MTIRNSTFSANFVTRGKAGDVYASNGTDAGGAIFSLNGHLAVFNATISGNQSTGSGAGIVVFNAGDPAPQTFFTLRNTIVANNGVQECGIAGPSITSDGGGNLIQHSDTCPGVVTDADPQLGSLQSNAGFTRTMAIPQTSPAVNKADAATSLLTDQRGFDRPQSGGFDIGAYEACFDRFGPAPCVRLVFAPPPDTAPLITQASPGGTVSPPSGNYTLDSVVFLTATPNTGFVFVNWTGAVADANSPSTTVTMDALQTVTANFAPQVSDSVPPTTTAITSPLPNAAGWNNSEVTVDLTAADNHGGSGVKQITYRVAGAHAVPTTTVVGDTASVTIPAEGVSTITFYAMDNAGNVEAENTLTVRLDQTPPTIIGTRTPAANVNGWNNTPVAVSFPCTDGLSGLALGSPPTPTIVSTERAGKSVAGICADLAGNAAAAAVKNINIDVTPPALTAPPD